LPDEVIDGFIPDESEGSMKFGRNAPKNAPALKLGPLLTGVVPAHPAEDDYLAPLGGGWQMLGNDQYGDCVAVTWSNFRRVMTHQAGHESYPSYDEVVALYKTQNPGFPTQDDGMDIQTALEYLHGQGGPDGVKAVAFAKVDHTNTEEVKAAIAVFGAIWVGVNVLQANMDEFNAGQPWDYVSSPLDGGHSVLVGGYGSGTGALGGDERFITWAQETSFTDLFWAYQVEEAWVAIWPEHLDSPAFQQGVNVSQLAADYQALTGSTFPVPAPQPDPTPPVPAPVPVPPAPEPVPLPPAPAPAAPVIVSPVDGDVFASGSVVLVGTGVPGDDVNLDIAGGAAAVIAGSVVDPGGAWSAIVQLDAGAYTVTVTQCPPGDPSNASEAATVTISVDEPTPVPPAPTPEPPAPTPEPTPTPTPTPDPTPTPEPPAPAPEPTPGPTPEPTPPAPTPGPVTDQADDTLAEVAREWVSERHTGRNRIMQRALRSWLVAQGYVAGQEATEFSVLNAQESAEDAALGRPF
jgi:hypothetical protein